MAYPGIMQLQWFDLYGSMTLVQLPNLSQECTDAHGDLHRQSQASGQSSMPGKDVKSLSLCSLPAPQPWAHQT